MEKTRGLFMKNAMRKTMAVMNGYHLLAFTWGLFMALVPGPVLAGGLYLQEFALRPENNSHRQLRVISSVDP